MSVLHNPGPGEILDRLSILALKLTYGAQAGRDLTHWQEERDALWQQLTESWGSVHVGHAYVDLASVNAALWQAEEEIRRLRALPEGARAQWTGGLGNVWTVAVAMVAMHIANLNDSRADLVALINREAGLDRPQEKL